MEAIAVEWVDSQEWAAIELALAAATAFHSSQQNHSISSSSQANTCLHSSASENHHTLTSQNLSSDPASTAAAQLETRPEYNVGCTLCVDFTSNPTDAKMHLVNREGCVREDKIRMKDLNLRNFSTIEDQKKPSFDPQTSIVISQEEVVKELMQNQSTIKDEEHLSKNKIGSEMVGGSIYETLEKEELCAMEDLDNLNTAKVQVEKEPQTKKCKQDLTWIALPKQPTPGYWRVSPSHCRDQTKCKLPFLQFKGKLVYSSTMQEVDVAAQELQKVISLKKINTQDAIAIGLDTEWKVVYNKWETPRKVATLQLCVDGDRSDVMQIIYSGIPTSLQNLLQDTSTCKVGLGIHGDAAKLLKDYNILVEEVEDLSVLANQKLTTSKRHYKQWSLSSLAQELTGKKVSKDPNIRCGDWEAFPLSQTQLQYAATDAFASLLLYQVLMSFPDPVLEDEVNIEPIPVTYNDPSRRDD